LDKTSAAAKSCTVGLVGIGLKATLKTRKLLIPSNAKNGSNSEFTQVRYTAGTQNNLTWFFASEKKHSNLSIFRDLNRPKRIAA